MLHVKLKLLAAYPTIAFISSSSWITVIYWSFDDYSRKAQCINAGVAVASFLFVCVAYSRIYKGEVQTQRGWGVWGGGGGVSHKITHRWMDISLFL